MEQRWGEGKKGVSKAVGLVETNLMFD